MKLPPKVLSDFTSGEDTTSTLVLFCLPEGALAIFTPETWEQLRPRNPQDNLELLDSLELRRKARRIAAFSDCQEISQQGRITVPPLFREKLGFVEGEDLVITGNERGYELWTASKWNEEALQLDEP